MPPRPADAAKFSQEALAPARPRAGHFQRIPNRLRNASFTSTRPLCGSFAAVIKELHPEILMPMCIFYIILRGLDTIEDDMTIPLDVSRIPSSAASTTYFEEGRLVVQREPCQGKG